MQKQNPSASAAYSICVSHLGTLKRTLTAWEDSQNAILQAITAVVNAHLSVAEHTLATAVESGKPSNLPSLGAALATQEEAVATSFASLTTHFAELAASYRDIKAACESLLTGLDAAVEACELKEIRSSAAATAMPREDSSGSDVHGHGAVGTVGTGDGNQGTGQAESRPTSTADPPLHRRARARLFELLEELLTGYAMQLSLTTAVLARLKPQQRQEQGAVYALPSFSTVHTPGLPPWARSDRDHLTALASTVALPPYISAHRNGEILEACEFILNKAMPWP